MTIASCRGWATVETVGKSTVECISGGRNLLRCEWSWRRMAMVSLNSSDVVNVHWI